MDLETVFLRRFAIEKKPDIFELIGAAIQIGAWKHPAEFEKHKHGLLKLLMSPDNLGDDVEEDEVIDFEDDDVIDIYSLMLNLFLPLMDNSRKRWHILGVPNAKNLEQLIE